MTGPDVPAAAYRIAGDAVPHSTCDDCAEESVPAVVAALAAAGWLHDPAEVAVHEADLLAIEGQRADLAARLFAQDAEVAALRYRVAERGALLEAVERTEGELRDEIQRLRAALATIRGEVEHAVRRGAWTLDVGPVRDALGAAGSGAK